MILCLAVKSDIFSLLTSNVSITQRQKVRAMTFSRRKNNPLQIGCSPSKATSLTWTCCVNAWKFFNIMLAFYFFNEKSNFYRKWKHQLRPFQAQYFGKTAAMLFCPSCQNINLLWRFSLEYPGADENRIKTTQVQLSFIEQLKYCCFWMKSSGVPFICAVWGMISSEDSHYLPLPP